MLPHNLWLLLSAIVFAPSVHAQSPQSLPLNLPLQLSGKNLTSSSPLVFGLPTSSSPLFLSVALCGISTNTNLQFFVTNSSDVPVPSASDMTRGDVWQLSLGPEGFGNWSGLLASAGGKLAIYNAGAGDSIELGASTSGVFWENTISSGSVPTFPHLTSLMRGAGPLHEQSDDLPFLGDTTSNQALLFSPPFAAPRQVQPTFPNYTLPPANLSAPSPPTNFPNFALLLAPTSENPTARPQTACALRSFAIGTNNGPSMQEEQPWLRDEDGWRTEWLVGGLTPATNYTVYAIQDETKLTSPIRILTKSASFACPLLHAVPFCPRTAYAAPLPAPPFPLTAHTGATLPDEFTQPFLSYLTNLTTSLLTFACGRELYSPLQTCADCQRAYRAWLCSTQIPRCAEPPPSPDAQMQPAQVPVQAQTSARNGLFPNASFAYTALLPCLETCHAADRACPNFLGFRCPRAVFGANASYGVGFLDEPDGESPGGGSVGGAQDIWGGVWCNGS